jgi:hypothetical protein
MMADYERFSNQDSLDVIRTTINPVNSLQSVRLDAAEKKLWISAYGLLLTLATAGNVLVTCFIIGKSINLSNHIPDPLPCALYLICLTLI